MSSNVAAEREHVEVLRRPRALRDVYEALLSLAMRLAEAPGQHGVLLLVDPRISRRRLREERERALEVLRSDVRERLVIVTWRAGELEGLPAGGAPALAERLDDLVSETSTDGAGIRLKRPSAGSQVLEVLVRHWMLRTGALTTKSLQEETGFSYPAVATALQRLERALRRTSDRRVELDRFPQDAWARLVAGADETRSTRWFVDRSGRPRSPEALRKRARRLAREDVAEGGAEGARHYVPDLDVVGDPWLSLSLHCPAGRADLRFVEALDPALAVRASRPEQTPALVIHCVQRPESGFHRGHDGVLWADPAACLLDLHEMRLEPQARELVAHFAARRAESAS